MSDKIKILGLFDYGCSTGFGNVASNIMTRLNDTGKYEITVIGINYDPAEDVNYDRFPGRIIPAITVGDLNAPDVYGRQKFLNELGKNVYDIVFTIQDTFIIQTIMKQILETQEGLPHKFATIMYYPIDAQPKPDWIEECIAKIDFPVPYTNYAKAETLKVMPELADKLCQPIYHGTNLDDFYYEPDREAVAKFRNVYFQGKADDKFLIINVNRNQPRKDIARNFMILKELRARGHKDAVLYLHMSHEDAGGNVLVTAQQFGFELGKDFILPSPKVFSVNQGMPVDMVNALYNASDMVLTTTLGEGWGLSITEAMATRTPIVAPNNTSITEILDNNRGYLVDSGVNKSDWINLGATDNERMRPLMDVDKACDAIEKIKRGELPDLDQAEFWAKQYNWDNICKEWVTIFEKAYSHAQQASTVPTMSRQERRKLERQQRKKKVSL